MSSRVIVSVCVAIGAVALVASGASAQHPTTTSAPAATSKPISPELKAQMEEIKAILAKHITPERGDADGAIKEITAKGKDVIPALTAMQGELFGKAGRMQELWPEALLEASRLGAANQALLQLQWGLDPVAAIEKWAAAQKNDSGEPLKLQNKPKRLLGDRLEQLIPGYLIYTSHFEPVSGGAAPPAGVAKDQPAAQHYVFTIDKKGNVETIDKNSAVNFLIQQLPAVKTPEAAKEALALWLCLCEQFVGEGAMLFEIDKDSMKVEQTTRGLSVSGRSVVKARNKFIKDSGQIDAQMTFGSTNTLGAATFTDNTKRGMMPVPP